MGKVKKALVVSSDGSDRIMMVQTKLDDLFIKQDNEIVFVTQPYVNKFISELIKLTGYDISKQIPPLQGSDATAAEHAGEPDRGANGAEH